MYRPIGVFLLPLHRNSIAHTLISNLLKTKSQTSRQFLMYTPLSSQANWEVSAAVGGSQGQQDLDW